MQHAMPDQPHSALRERLKRLPGAPRAAHWLRCLLRPEYREIARLRRQAADQLLQPYTLTGEDRIKTWLLAIYPALLITLTPGYFWYLSLTPDGPGHVNVLFGMGMSADWLADPQAPAHLARVKALLDEVNAEDKGCTERVYQGLLSGLASPGPLSHLERPNYEFAQYLARKTR